VVHLIMRFKAHPEVTAIIVNRSRSANDAGPVLAVLKAAGVT
jgi:hypothetical protein